MSCNNFFRKTKGINEVKTWGLEWKVAPANFLAEGENIISANWSVIPPSMGADPTPLEIVSSSINATQTTVQVRLGTLGQRYRLLCRITTSEGNVEDQSMVVHIKYE